MAEIDEDDYRDQLNDFSEAKGGAEVGDVYAADAVKKEGGLVPPHLRLDSGYSFRRAQELDRSLEKLTARYGVAGPTVTGLKEQVQGYEDDAKALQLADQMYSMFVGQATMAAGAVQRMESLTNYVEVDPTNLEGELKGKSKRLKVGQDKVKGAPDESIEDDQIAFTTEQRTFARASNELLVALQGDIPFFLRRAAKDHKDQQQNINDRCTTVRVVTNQLRELTGGLLGTVAGGVAPGTAFGVNVVDEAQLTAVTGHCDVLHGVLAGMKAIDEVASDRFEYEVRPFRSAVNSLRDAGRKLARTLASQRKLLAEAGAAADNAKGVPNQPGSSKNSISEALLSAGSVEEAQTILSGALDIGRNARESLEGAQGQVLSHRGKGFKLTHGGRTQKDDPKTQADVKQLDKALEITKEWMKTAQQKLDEGMTAKASADSAIKKSGVSGGTY